jgi:hypothetical protein
MAKTSTANKKPPKEAMLFSHLQRLVEMFDKSIATGTMYEEEAWAIELIFVVLWQAILRPDEVLGTQRHPQHAVWEWVTFLDKFRKPVHFHTKFDDIGCAELTLRDGRKNDATNVDPPIILAADHLLHSQRFNACFQL